MTVSQPLVLPATFLSGKKLIPQFLSLCKIRVLNSCPPGHPRSTGRTVVKHGLYPFAAEYLLCSNGSLRVEQVPPVYFQVNVAVALLKQFSQDLWGSALDFSLPSLVQRPQPHFLCLHDYPFPILGSFRDDPGATPSRSPDTMQLEGEALKGPQNDPSPFLRFC